MMSSTKDILSFPFFLYSVFLISIQPRSIVSDHRIINRRLTPKRGSTKRKWLSNWTKKFLRKNEQEDEEQGSVLKKYKTRVSKLHNNFSIFIS